ncbi:MAG: PD-(D/E)XK nuclease family protein [Acidobacteria bacterium]|nr:PD-(D/E)XK nuclease family protein [Acidobacteriota bacterium]
MKRVVHLSQLSHSSLIEPGKPGAEVFTPHRRAARVIGSPYQPLDREAVRLLRRNGWEMATGVVARRNLIAAVKQVLKLDEPSPVAARMTPSMQALLRTGIDPNNLLNYQSERVRQLAEITLVYQAMLHQQRLLDPSEALWHASRLKLNRKPIVVYGYFRPRIDELAFIDALAGEGSRFLVPCADHSIFRENRKALEFLRSRNWEVEEPGTSLTTYGQRIANSFLTGNASEDRSPAHSYPNLEAEVRGVLAQIKELLISGVNPDEIVMVARDDKIYGPTLLSIGWEYEVPVRVLYNFPLDQTRFGVWVRLMLEAASTGFSFEPTIQMLSHRMGQGLGLSAQSLKASRSVHTEGLDGWKSLEIDLSQLDWPESATRTEWVRLLRNILDKTDSRKHAEPWARELKAFEIFHENVDGLLFDEAEEIVTIETFAADVTELLSSLTVPFQPGVGGVELHTPEVLFGSQYRHVFVMGMNEGVMPAPVNEDPILDFYDRKLLVEKGIGLESAADVARREVLSFYLMIGIATERISFSYPRIVNNDESIPSAFMQRMGLVIRPAVELELPLASREEARRAFIGGDAILSGDDVLPAAIRSLEVEAGRESPAAFDEYDGVVGLPLDAGEIQWSASQLTTLGQCPFKWFASKVLLLKEPDEMETELFPSLRGRLYHKALELAFAGLIDVEDPREAALMRLDEAFIQAEREIGIPGLPAWPAQRAEHLQTLRNAIGSADFIEAGSRVIHTEMTFQSVWHGLKVRGSVDRVDRTSAGIDLIDYKTSASVPPGAKNEDGDAKLDLQMPIYIHAAGSSRFPGEAITGIYYSLKKAEVLERVEVADSPELQAFAERVKRHLKDGDYPVDPDNERKACTFCEFDLVCRQGNRLDRKRSA